MGRPRSTDEKKYIQVGLTPTMKENWDRLMRRMRSEHPALGELSEADAMRAVIVEAMRARGIEEAPRPPTIPPGSETPPAGSPKPNTPPRSTLRIPTTPHTAPHPDSDRTLESPGARTPRSHKPPSSRKGR